MVLKGNLPLALPLCISIEPTNLCDFKLVQRINLRCSILQDKEINHCVCKNCELPYSDLPEDNISPIEK